MSRVNRELEIAKVVKIVLATDSEGVAKVVQTSQDSVRAGIISLDLVREAEPPEDGTVTDSAAIMDSAEADLEVDSAEIPLAGMVSKVNSGTGSVKGENVRRIGATVPVLRATVSRVNRLPVTDKQVMAAAKPAVKSDSQISKADSGVKETKTSNQVTPITVDLELVEMDPDG